MDKNLLVKLFVVNILLLSSCKIYQNNSIYKVPVGKKIKIYYSTNSCCQYCLLNENNLKHLDLISEKGVFTISRNCPGCDYTRAFIFRSTSAGCDTIYLKQILGREDCHKTDLKNTEVYIVNVK